MRTFKISITTITILAEVEMTDKEADEVIEVLNSIDFESIVKERLRSLVSDDIYKRLTVEVSD